MGVEGLRIPATAVKFFGPEEDVPAAVTDNHISEITLTSCQAVRQASLGDAVCLTRHNIGCVAAAISLGLVDEDDESPPRTLNLSTVTSIDTPSICSLWLSNSTLSH